MALVNFRQLIIYITLFGMEFSWLYALLNAANKSVANALSVLLMLLTLLVSFAVSRALRYLSWNKVALTALSWVVWPIVMLLLIKVQLFGGTSFTDPAWLGSIPHALGQMVDHLEPALLILLSSAALWWLGRRLAYITIDFKAALVEFQLGLVLLVIVFFVAYETNLDQSASVPVAMTFFFMALIGISISHTQDNPSWLNSWRQGNWLGMLLISIGIILLLGLLISIIVTPDLLQLFLRALKWLWGIVERMLTFFANLIPKQQEQPLPSLPPMAGPGQDEGPGLTLPEWLLPGARLAWTIIAGGVLLIAIWRVTTQIIGWMRNRASTAGGEVESLRGAFKTDLLNWFKRLLSRLFGIKFGSLNRGRLKNVPPEIASVRQLYGQLLRWGSEKGYPRAKPQTPLEYQYVLNGAISENRDDLDFITCEYINVRYGCNLPTEEKLNQLKQKWHNLRKTELRSPETRGDAK